MQIKYYVTYGMNRVPDQSPEDFRKAFEEYKKAVEKVGLKILFYGAPYGVSEDCICVLEGSYESYMKLMESQAIPPYTHSRTNMVLTL